MPKCPNAQMPKCPNAQMPKCPNAPTQFHWASFKTSWLTLYLPIILQPAIGLVLVVAAKLKLDSIVLQPADFFVPSYLQAPLVLWEIALGIWLISGVNNRMSRIAAILTFATFAAASLYMAFIGQATCGCLGAIKASPWLILILDVAILTLLLVFSPKKLTSSENSYAWYLSRAFVGGLAVFLVFIMILTLKFGSLEFSLNYIQGRRILVSPAILDFENAEAGSTLTKTVQIHNWSSEKITLIGGSSSCNCITSNEYPLQINPNEHKELVIQLQTPSETSSQNLFQIAEIWTDYPGHRRLRIPITCRLEKHN